MQTLHDPYATATPSQRLAVTARSVRLAKIEAAAKAKQAPAPVAPEPEPVEIGEPDPVKAWVERQKAIPLPKPRWFSVEKDLGPVAPRAIRMEDIIRAVSAHYNLTRRDILSCRRTAHVAHARQVAIFLCKMLTDHALTAIGRYMGRDHTTILYSVRKMERLVQIDHALAAEIKAIEASIGR